MLKAIKKVVQDALKIPLAILLVPGPIVWKTGALALVITLMTVIGLKELIPVVNRYASPVLVWRKATMALGLWVLFFAFIVRRLESEKFWKLLVLTAIGAAWVVFVLSESAAQ